MSANKDGSDSSKLSSQQTPAPQIETQSTPIMAHDLNFNINDILSSNHEVNVNDSSFQSIVQTLSNSSAGNIQPSYAHLPAELRDLFSTTETDDLLSAQVNAEDASLLQGDMAALWGRSDSSSQPQQLQQQSSQTHDSPFAVSSQQQQVATNFTVSMPSTATSSNAISPLLQAEQSQPLSRQITPTLQPQQSFQSGPISTAQHSIQHSSALMNHQQQANHIQLQLPQQAQRPQSPLQQQQLLQTPPLPSQPSIPVTKQQVSQSIMVTQLPSTGTTLSTPQQQLPQQQPIQPPKLPVLPPQSSSTAGSSTSSQPNTQQQQTIQVVQPTTPSTTAPVFKTPALPVPGNGLQIPTKSAAAQTKIVAPNGIASSSSQAGAASGGAGALTETTGSAGGVSGTAASGGGGSGGGGSDRIDYDTLTDVMGYAGVDLREEAEHFVREGQDTSLPDGIDRSRYQDFMNIDMLRERLLGYAKYVNIKRVDNDFVAYIALATQDRLRQVMQNMVKASKHRTFDPFDEPPMISTTTLATVSKGQKRFLEEEDEEEEGKGEENNKLYPLYKIHVKQNVMQQLATLEKVDRQTTLDLDTNAMDGDDDDDEMPDMDEKVRPVKGWYSAKLRQSLPTRFKTEQKQPRKLTVKDAIFAMERDVQAGRGTNQRTLLKAYNGWLK
ncbi:transcription initiation factor TFIID component TAF4 family-domain-containing protein [Mycotypha africana]|uniref:transcription initiation factor TFIID component TAF4 family-domain-containing protein n=1 Tax=Mycotypha africana TaxID=64632 RepID=UPI0023009DB9|nr:transcription initiation factor TFIID component TAF4 family-domain-containing protein [Mycotypha africana]KAI8975698.1 transcription initiation factor TFIID component TAF4 family-domain-containing protein [Mycotypha africana]